MSTEATRLKARWQHFAGRLGNWLGIGKERFMEHARERLTDILTSYGTVRLGSKMWVPKPEIKMSEKGTLYPADLENLAYDRVQSRFGTNGKFIDKFMRFFKYESINEIEAALVKLRRLFTCAAQAGSDIRRLIPLLHAIMTEPSFCHFSGYPGKFSLDLDDISQKIADGKDPVKELDFDEYIAKLIKEEIDRIINY